MKFGLGIDTGGTYTDSVIYDFTGEQIIETAKARTVQEDLEIGISNVLNKLSPEILRQVQIVSLSTTLATNAAVEGKIGDGTLILIGCDKETVDKKSEKYGLPSTSDIIFLGGGHNSKGEVISEPDWNILKNKIEKYKDKTDGFAIVQLWGMRNPDFEKQAKKFILKWTGLPVVCAHELLGDLNFLKRAATALLNVKLIPIVEDFMDSIKISLKKRNIIAPLVIVRGDGSLMSEEFARKRPLETLLSGPAASVVGGMNITGKQNSIIIDMGGTTTDLALVNKGRLKLAYGGIKVGKWITGTKSISLKTVGLGGDSAIRIDEYNNLEIGPERVTPLSWVASNFPDVLKEMKSQIKDEEKCEFSFFYLVKNIEDESKYSTRELNIVEILKKGPNNVKSLANYLNLSIFDIRLENLIKNGIIAEGCLTPTDIMHINGQFIKWNREAALIGGQVMAKRLNITLDQLVNTIDKKIKKEIYFHIVKMLIDNRDGSITGDGINKQLRELIMMSYQDYFLKEDKSHENFINPIFNTGFDLIGIGAPVHIFLPDVADVLNTDSHIPENAAVANAIGAITGNISVREEVEIKPEYNINGISSYNCFSSEEHQEFVNYEEALCWSKKQAEELVRIKAKARDAGQLKIFVEVNRKENKDVLLGTKVVARAIGTFEWL